LLLSLNPSLQDHKEAMRNTLSQQIEAKRDSTGIDEDLKAYIKTMDAIDLERADIELESAISRENYYLFSLTKYRNKDNKIATVGYGFLGKVWIKKVFTPNL
jgi:hypothetical protein